MKHLLLALTLVGAGTSFAGDRSDMKTILSGSGSSIAVERLEQLRVNQCIQNPGDLAVGEASIIGNKKDHKDACQTISHLIFVKKTKGLVRIDQLTRISHLPDYTRIATHLGHKHGYDEIIQFNGLSYKRVGSEWYQVTAHKYSKAEASPERAMARACFDNPELYGVAKVGTDTDQKRACARFVSKKFGVDFDYQTNSRR